MLKLTNLDIKAGLLTLVALLFCIGVVLAIKIFPALVGIILAIIASALATSALFILIREFLD